MLDTMHAVNGAGLAAPQIGVDLQLVIFGTDAQPALSGCAARAAHGADQPVITPLGDAEEEDWEGCLSVPGLRGVVPRWARIRYTGFDPYGDPIDRVVEGFHARVVQHECDHLIGQAVPDAGARFHPLRLHRGAVSRAGCPRTTETGPIREHGAV
jgi:peptide deformylase